VIPLFLSSSGYRASPGMSIQLIILQCYRKIGNGRFSARWKCPAALSTVTPHQRQSRRFLRHHHPTLVHSAAGACSLLNIREADGCAGAGWRYLPGQPSISTTSRYPPLNLNARDSQDKHRTVLQTHGAIIQIGINLRCLRIVLALAPVMITPIGHHRFRRGGIGLAL